MNRLASVPAKLFQRGFGQPAREDGRLADVEHAAVVAVVAILEADELRAADVLAAAVLSGQTQPRRPKPMKCSTKKPGSKLRFTIFGARLSRIQHCAAHQLGVITQHFEAQARAIGEALRRERVPVDRVLSSRWCRCLDTARLLELGVVDFLAADLPGLEGELSAAIARIDAGDFRPTPSAFTCFPASSCFRMAGCAVHSWITVRSGIVAFSIGTT